MLKHDLIMKVTEHKVTFLNGLRSEYKLIISNFKAHEQFKDYSLSKMVGIIKSHEKEVLNEAKNVSNVGLLTFVAKTEGSKGKASKIVQDDSDSYNMDNEFPSEIKVLMISNPKMLFKKNFSKLQGNKFNEDRTLNRRKQKRRKSCLAILVTIATTIMSKITLQKSVC